MVSRWTAWRPRICTAMYIVVYILTLLAHLGSVDATLTINARKTQLEVNVGKSVSLIWSYNTGGLPYEAILWGKGDAPGINFQNIYYAKKPNQGSPVKAPNLDPGISSRVKITGGSSLVISDAKLADEGYYICEIRTQFVTVKEKIYLKVYAPLNSRNTLIVIILMLLTAFAL